MILKCFSLSLIFHSRLIVVIENGRKSAIEQLETTVLPISTLSVTKSVASLKHVLEALTNSLSSGNMLLPLRCWDFSLFIHFKSENSEKIFSLYFWHILHVCSIAFLALKKYRKKWKEKKAEALYTTRRFDWSMLWICECMLLMCSLISVNRRQISLKQNNKKKINKFALPRVTNFCTILHGRLFEHSAKWKQISPTHFTLYWNELSMISMHQ